MIPIALPIVLLILTFLILTGVTLLFLTGSDYFIEFVRGKILRRPVRERLPAGAAGMVGASVGGTPGRAFAPVAAVPRVEGYTLPEFLRYHRGHTWVALEGEDTAFIGLDEFASKLIGKPSLVAAPRVDQQVRQGERGWTLRRKGKDLNVPFPLDGKIIAVNERLVENPELLSKDPYGSGWLAMLKAGNIRQNLLNLLSGSGARKWTEECAAELRSVFSGRLGLVFQDGGLPEDGVADYLEPAEWDELVSRIFAGESEKPAE